MFLLLLTSTTFFGQKLIISQVYEGSSNDKWIEITNVGTSDIDMAAGGYKLGIWTVSGDTGNGAISGTPSSSIVLSGTLTPGQSYLMRNSSASTTVPHNPMPTANTFNTTVAAFNGNDALAIFTGTSTIVDAFGVGINNKDVSYHRNSNILSSNTTFTVSEWTSRTLAQIAAATSTDTEYIGKHIYGVTNYTLTYNANGGTGTAPSAVSNPSGTVITLPSTTLTRSGYTFSGWNVNSIGNGTNYNSGANYSMPGANTTLYARWAYTITYNANGGTGTTPTAQTNYNSITTALNNGSGLTRTDYTFAGWKITAAGTTADYAAGATYTPSTGNATTTLYAHWIPTTPELSTTPSTLSAFTYVEGYGPSATKSFTLTGANLDGTDVSLLPGDNYEISIDNGTTWVSYTTGPVVLTAYNGTSKAVLVRLKAGLSAGTYNNASNDIITIEGGGDASGPVVTLSGTVAACLAPTTQSTVSSFTSVGTNGMTVNFTGGNGMGRVVIINTSNSFTNPSNTLPAANSIYSGSGEQVIYTGTGNTIAVTGLSPSTTYYYRAYEYNICSGTYLYNTTTPTNNPRSQTTACDVPVNPNGDIELDNPYCASATLVYELSDPIQDGVTYYWQTVSGGTSTANPLVFAPGAEVAEPYTVTVGGLYYVRAYNGFCWSAGSYVTGSPVVIAVGAGIGTQPTNQNVAIGATATFTVTASGTAPFTYQWQESPTGLAGSWVNVGTSSSTLSLINVPLTKNGYKYRVIVSNDCTSKTSDVVTLSVNVTPVSIWNNPITGTNPGQSTGFYTTGDVKNANIIVSGISKGSGITGAAANDRYSASAWSTTTLDANDYFEFTLTPNTNYKIDFDSFAYTGQISGGASNHAFRSSLDGFISNIGTPTVSGTTINLSGAAYQNITTPITFRFYTYGVSASTRTFSINDFDFKGNVLAACVPASLTAFPTTGPAGTVVTITGSDFTAASTVKFGTVDAVVEYVSATILKATVPANADGNIIVDTSLTCDSETAFTLIKNDTTSCEAPLGGSGSGSTYASDIIIYEVYDENGGVGGVVSIYNGTNATVNLADYSFFRAGTYGDTYSSYGTLSGNLASGQLAVIGVSGSLCGIAPTGNGSITSGFNADDGFRLMKGTTVIDDVKAPNYIGYYMRRNNTNLAPATTYNDAQWTTQTLDAGECLPADEVAQVPAVKSSPIVVTQPSYTLTCDVNTSLALTATEGYAGGNGLTYQWYVLGTTGNWTAIIDGGVYSGANSQTLNISDVSGLANFQYYCQVRENTQTCYTATNAAQIKDANNIWASNVWSNGMPVLGSKVVIAGSYNTQEDGVLDVCDLTVNTSGSIRVKPNFPVTVKKKITNLGSANNFVVESDANLIQKENVANQGNIIVERQVTDMNNVTNQIDYVYWSSPVNGQLIKGAAGFSPNTPSNGYLQYNEANDMFAVTGDVNFLTGKGYAIRAENGTNGYTKTYTFTGIPNNGNIQYQNLKWTSAVHGFNLIGNPYPSNIDFDKLFTLNNTKIYSTAFFWTNNSYTPIQVGSGYNGNNYAIYNGTGGSPATYNPSNPYDGSVIPDGKIKVGQAFIIQVKDTGKDLPLNFDNNIRVTDNGNFYQKASKNRFWLTLTSPNNLVNTILLGYITGATNNYETDFDGELFAIGSDSFYSLLGAKKLAIQGKSDNFTTDDVVTLGNVFSENGNYTISLRTAEGIFDGIQTIYLRDKVLDKYINLSSQSNYTFEATKGTNNTRFEIVYKDKVLSSDETKKSEFLVYRNGEDFIIQSAQKLGHVEVYDASGKLIRKVFSKENNLIINADSLPNGIFIIKAENSGNIRTKKIIK
ncbi:InlB B-repeat-containing protein [Epilithonimonas sp. UC225_85]|uniref:InlB B-repeat-containing protein n=1 Tax=Epilithonimonas sp. UC225_85 TaxID=3350167 RepID=UPI0036D3C0B3